ncbi:putative Histidine kinase [Nitrosotalea devaniterrae]|uniref:Putative Histidine kinase n=1 Tax=Nitrosotalea devaniterrae TaxID=1078905 RepID=A0A128A1K6_9ARCH|nr:putative Histidine kinase [Candidatus Nitrosotalea devanaterra]
MTLQPKELGIKSSDEWMVSNELKELDAAESELVEKEKHLTMLTNESFSKMKEVSKINRDLQNRIKSLQELSASLNRKNDELKMANKELERKTILNDQVSLELKEKLERVTQKEKELSMQRDFLTRRLDETTQDLVKAEKFAIIGELSARLAHDLRNPLSVIKNTMDVMSAKQNMKIEERLQHIARFKRAVQRMSHQIDDVLDFVKKTEMMLHQVSLRSIIDSAINVILIPPNVKIFLPSNDVSIMCDSRKLEAVFSNVILNAIQAINDNGEVKIRVMDIGTHVKIEFEDTGSGISVTAMQKIFDPLFTTKQTGTGLGLSICKNIVEQHGGTITVKSPPTIFTITLPKNM